MRPIRPPQTIRLTRKTRAKARAMLLEALESRAMLSVDLTGAFVGLTQVTSGQNNTVTGIIQNLGDEAVKGTALMQFYLSADGQLDPANDLALGKPVKLSGKLGAAGSDTDTGDFDYSLAIPYNVPAGNYHLIALIDSAGKITESDETNNAVIGAVTVVQPDYDLSATVTESKVPAAVVEGKAAKGTVKVTLVHEGGVPLLGKTPKIDINIVARPVDAQDASEDVVIGAVKGANIAGLGVGTSIRNVTAKIALPTTLPAGQYNIVAVIDTTNQLAETDETNNEGVLSNAFSIAPAFEDLELSSATHSLAATVLGGDTSSGSVVITNRGNVDAVGAVDVIFVAKRDGEPDVTLGQATGVKLKLKPGAASKPIAVSLLVSGTLTDGATYTVHVLIAPAADILGDVSENNALGPVGDPVTVTQPDYDLAGTVTEVSVASLLQGATAKGTLKVNISNVGDTPLPAKAPAIVVRIVARPNAAADASQDVTIGTASKVAIGGLKNSDTPRVVSASINVPSTLTAGDYKLVAIIDDTELQVESDETNNEAVGATLLTVQPAFEDLQLVNATTGFSTTGLGGDTKVGTITLKNLGNVPAVGSVDITFVARRNGEADVIIGESLGANVNIKPGETAKPINVDLQLPGSLTDGATYTLHALITPGADIAGDTPVNNTSGQIGPALTITQPPAFLLDFGDTISFVQNARGDVPGPFGTSTTTTQGNFSSTNGRTGIYSYTVISGIPGPQTGILSLTLANTFPLQVATFTMTFKGNRPIEINGRTILFGANLTGDSGSADVRIVEGSIGLLLDTQGEFKFL